MPNGFVGGYYKSIKEGTPAQKRAAKLSGAKRQFPLGLFVCAGNKPRDCGRVTDYRLMGSGVQIKVDSTWYPKSEVTKNPKIIRVIMRKR